MPFPRGSTSIPTCMWNSGRARRNWEGSRGGLANSLSITRTGFFSERTASRRKRCTQTTSVGSKLGTSISPTGGTRARGGGRFMEWSCRMVCLKRSTTKMQTRFSPSSKGGTKMKKLFLFGLTVSLFAVACQKKEEPKPVATAAAKSAVVVNISGESIIASTPSAEFRLTPSGALTATLVGASWRSSLEDKALDVSQVISVSKKKHVGARFDLAGAKVRDTSGKLGALGKHVEINGTIPETDLTEALELEIYDDFPNLALVSLSIRNPGPADVPLDWVKLQRHQFVAPSESKARVEPLWTFQGASLKWGKDEIFAMPAKFSQENPFGAPVPTKDDLGAVGGGIPVVAFWSRDIGEAIGHVETVPFTLSIPVETTAVGNVETAVRVPANTILKPGEVFSTPRTFLAVYRGDFYQPLSLWSKVVAKEGLEKPRNNDENYAVSWCGWGYEFAVTPKQMLDTIPKLKELGIHWATLDDGWFNNYGDWQANSKAFTGDAIPDMIKKFHDQGIKVQVWWLPLGVEDGHFGYGGRKYVVSEVLKEHPDWLILDKNGKPARMARNLATLCPAVP